MNDEGCALAGILQAPKPDARLRIKCNRSSGFVEAFDGDCVGITFMMGGKAHNVVSHGVSRGDHHDVRPRHRGGDL